MALMSGTSMAAPHTAGRAALLLEANPTMTTGAVNSAVLSSATTGTIASAGGSPNRILYTGAVTSVEPPPPPPPTPTPTPIRQTLSVRISANGQPIVSIRWTGAASSSVNIHRNGAKLTNTPNDGVYSDRPPNQGPYQYKVCNAGSSTCSAKSSITV